MKYVMIANTHAFVHSELSRDYTQHLVLAQYMHDPAYLGMTASKVSRGHYVILDNGAHEDVLIDLQEYAEVAHIIQPSVLVLTDEVGAKNTDSRERSLDLIQYLNPKYLQKTRLMYVPQGQNKQQVVAEYRWAFKNLDPEKYIVGIGQGYLQWVETPEEVNEEATRLRLFDEIVGLQNFSRFQIHILGARWSAGGAAYHTYPNIIGIDTIKPLTCEAHGTLFPNRPDGVRALDRTGDHLPNDDLWWRNINAFCLEYGCEVAI